MKLNKLKKGFFLALSLCFSIQIGAQSFLKAKEKKSYECGYVHKMTLLEKAKPMKLISKATGSLLKAKPKSDLKNAAISINLVSGLIPQNKVDFATKTPGWQTCGEGVSVVFLNYEGIGLTDTDGDVKVNGKKLDKAGMGTYFQGYPASERGNKTVEITSSNGNKVAVTLEPAAPLEIISVNGVPKGGDIKIDGTKDVVIELKGGDADLDSELYVEFIVSAMSLKVPTHLYPSKPSNKIVIPKEAFKNFETSPLPIVKKNTLSVTRVKNSLLRDTDAGIVQKTVMFSDFTPILIEGDIAGGNLLKNSFSKDKNTNADSKFKTVQGEYNVNINKRNPYMFPPTSRMKRIGISSLVVRGNLFKSKTTTKTSTTTNYTLGIKTITTTKTTIKKWFPELSDDTWEKFANMLYDKLAADLQNNYGVEIIPVDQVLATKAYADMKPIQDTVTRTFVEKGAYGTKRLIKTGAIDYIKDIKTTFVGDYTNEKMIQELDLDGLIAVTIDLDFDLETSGLNPVIKMTAFAPNATYRTAAQYFEMNFSTESKNLEESGKYRAGYPEEGIYNVIKGDELFKAFNLAMKELQEGEAANPAYHRLWENRD